MCFFQKTRARICTRTHALQRYSCHPHLFPSLSQSAFPQNLTIELNTASHTLIHTIYTNKELQNFTHIHTHRATNTCTGFSRAAVSGGCPVQKWFCSRERKPCLQPINQALPATLPSLLLHHLPLPMLFHSLPACIPLHFADKSLILYTISHAPPHLC